MTKLNEYKRIKTEEVHSYIKAHNGQFKVHPYIPYCNVYECNNNMIIIENTKEKKFTLYFDMKKYYDGYKKVFRLREERQLAKQQTVIKDIENNKEVLLATLFEQLGIEKPEKLKDIDLKLINKKIKEYGYEKAYFNLLLNLIVFCGEYVREQRGGGWILIKDLRWGDNEPVYIDSTHRNYSFWINVILTRQYLEKEKFDIKDVIEGALLPEVFKVMPNPTFGNPNGSR